MHIISNNQWRFLLNWFELTDKEQKEFDWEDVECMEGDTYFRYRGQVYPLSNFMRIEEDHPLSCLNWHGYEGHSYFNGVLVKLHDCGDSVIVGRYTC
ncbi:MAG: hypothetical protein LUQ26_05345 [Methylococcaceae bacterium]|nr:hypothetical protein [Methylococcaceae bacterium]